MDFSSVKGKVVIVTRTTIRTRTSRITTRTTTRIRISRTIIRTTDNYILQIISKPWAQWGVHGLFT